MKRPTSVAAYFTGLPADQRAPLQKLRETIAAAVPEAEEAVDAHRDELGERVTGTGTISFEYGRPLPARLVKKVVKTRLAEVSAKRG